MRLLAQSRHSFMNLYDLFLRNYLIPKITPFVMAVVCKDFAVISFSIITFVIFYYRYETCLIHQNRSEKQILHLRFDIFLFVHIHIFCFVFISSRGGRSHPYDKLLTINYKRYLTNTFFTLPLLIFTILRPFCKLLTLAPLIV